MTSRARREEVCLSAHFSSQPRSLCENSAPFSHLGSSEMDMGKVKVVEDEEGQAKV